MGQMKHPAPDNGKIETLTVLLNKLHAMKTAKIVRIKDIAKHVKETEAQVSQWVMQRTRRPGGDVTLKLQRFAAKQTIRIALNRRMQTQYRSAYNTARLLFPEEKEAS